jgi:hypothetical protein
VGALGKIGGSVDKAVNTIFKKYPSMN